MEESIMSEIREKPVHKIRYGNVSAAIWLNVGETGNFHSVTFQRSFKDGERWRESRSFNERDLSNLTKVAADAHSWIVRKKEEVAIGLESAALPPSPFAKNGIEDICLEE
jgi:hypothetical protein